MSPVGLGTASDGTPVAPDGSPVGLYRAFPPGSEPGIVHGSIPARAQVLELGSGAGRVTHALLSLGHPVVAVDQSADMLAHVRGARTVRSDIESLRLGERFPAVVLGSYLFNTPVPGQREAFLETCRRHVASDGVVLVQRTSPAWALSLRAGQVHRSGEFVMTITQASVSCGVLAATQEIQHGTVTWTHSWKDVVYTDSECRDLAASGGFALSEWLDDDHEWALLRPH